MKEPLFEASSTEKSPPYLQKFQNTVRTLRGNVK